MMATKYRFVWLLLSGLLLVALLLAVHLSHTDSIFSRIEKASELLSRENPPGKNPVYEQMVIALAREPSSELANAFKILDEKRRPDRFTRPDNDRVWLTGTLVTILAFETDPVVQRDWNTYGRLKSRIAPPGDVSPVEQDLSKIRQDDRTNKMLAEWPWELKRGRWQLRPVDVHLWGPSDGELLPRFDYYQKHYVRRTIP